EESLSLFRATVLWGGASRQNEQEMGSKIHLSCNYTSAYSLLWYKQSPGSAPQYLLLILQSTGRMPDDDSFETRFFGKLNEEKTRVDLMISSAEVTDSALYYCALRPTVTGNREALYKNLTSPEISTLGMSVI
uniref:Immunoglobulin V-set domain-containing protein n=1 Tax=Esox lucius TaxID=8010 RepID=A0AAY5KNA6_ESOLU